MVENGVSDGGRVSAHQVLEERRSPWIAAINAADTDGFVAVLKEDAVWPPMGRSGIPPETGGAKLRG